MTSIDTTSTTSTAVSDTTTTVPSRRRKAALAGVGVLNCALPALFTLNITRMLVTGDLADHRYHQLTGQGEILFALWLVPIVLMVRAGWRGRRPAAAVGLQHLALGASGVVTAVVAPGGGAPFLVAVIGGTGVLLWAALPKRPRLRLAVQVDPLLAPVALVCSALLAPYAVDQLALQNATTSGFHASNPHFFDQAWIAVTLGAMAVLAALLPAARAMIRWVAASLVVLGAAGLALGEAAGLHGAFLGLGVVAGLASIGASIGVRRRAARN
jgi:hypothetical protein